MPLQFKIENEFPNLMVAHVFNPSLYRTIIGALQYLTFTQLNLTFPVNKVCQFMYNPVGTHWNAVK